MDLEIILDQEVDKQLYLNILKHCKFSKCIYNANKQVGTTWKLRDVWKHQYMLL